MTTPSVPRCGRMDEHEPHRWTAPGLILLRTNEQIIPERRYQCPGVVIHEGGAQCQHCAHVVCTCDAELARERHEEWYS